MGIFDNKTEESDELVLIRGEASEISSNIRALYPDAEDIWGKSLEAFEKILLEGGSESVQIAASRALIEVYNRLGQMRGMFDDRLGALDAKMRLAEADIANSYLASRTVAAIKKCRIDFERIRADIKTASIGGAMWNELGSRLSELEGFWAKLQETAIDFDLRHGPENKGFTEEQIMGRMKEFIVAAIQKIGDPKRAKELLGKAWSYYQNSEQGWKAKIINKGDLLQNEAGMLSAINEVVP